MPSRHRVSRVLLALIAGLVVGIIAGATGSQWALTALHVIAPLGTLWINAIRMTVVPLVIALLFTSIVGTDRTSEIGREAVVAFATFAGSLFLAAGIAWLLAPHLIDDMRVTPETSAALRASVSTTASATKLQLDHLTGFGDWLAGLVPSNAIRAAADGAMLPLIIFTALFAFGARQIAADRRAVLTTFFAGVADAMQVIVEWAIVAAPIGVFCLIAGPAAASGAQIAGAIGYYVVAISVLLFLFTMLMYPIAHFAGIHLARFSRGVLPAQAVALASSSSLASLPALMSGATELGISRRTSGFVLPLSVGAFKAATPISWTVGTLFVARLYGATLTPGAVFWVALTAVAASFTIPGVPQGSLLVLSGVLASVGVPAEGVALLIAADTIPDLVGTMTNVTGDMVATVVVARATGELGVSDAELGGLNPELTPSDGDAESEM
jgi:Na+/H+-dicarboxylate symporter